MVDNIQVGGLYKYDEYDSLSNREHIRPLPFIATVIAIHSSEEEKHFYTLGANPDLERFKVVDLLTSKGTIMREVLIDLHHWSEL